MTGSDAVVAVAPRRLARTRRWLKRLLLALVVLGVVVRLALPWILPPLLDGLVKDRGLTLAYERLDLSLLGGHLQLWHATLGPRLPADATPAARRANAQVQVEFVDLDLDMTALLRGVVCIRRAEVDGVDVRLVRAADGSLDLLRALAGPGAPAPAPEPTAPPATTPAPAAPAAGGYDFSLPFQLLAGRVQEVRVALRDEARTPPLETRLELDLRLSDLGVPDTVGRIDLTAVCAPLLDNLQVRATLASGPRSLSADATLAVQGVHLQPIAHWLAPLGVRVRARSLELATAVHVQLRPGADSPTAAAGALRLDGLHLFADQYEAAAIDQVQVDVDACDPQALLLRALRVVGVRAHAEQLADGALRVAGLELAPVPAAPAPPPASRPAAAAAPALRWRVARAEVQGLLLRFRDEGTTPPFVAELRGEQITATDLAVPAAATDPRAQLAVRLQVPGLVERVQLGGSLGQDGADRDLALDLTLAGIQGEGLAPLLRGAGLAPELQQGELTLALTGRLRDGGGGTPGVELAVTGLALRDGDERFGLDRITLDLPPTPPGQPLRVRAAVVDGLRLPLRRDAAGALHLCGVRTLPPGPAARTPASAASGPAAGAPASGSRPANPGLVLERVALQRARCTLVDEQHPERAALLLQDLGVEVTALELGGATAGVPRGQLALSAAVPGVCDQLTLRGPVALCPSPLRAETELALRAAGLRGPALAVWLAGSGVAPLWPAAEFQATLAARAEQRDATLLASVSLADVALRDGARTPLRLGRAAVRDLTLAPGSLQIGAVEIAGPELELEREPSGALVAAGVRFLPPVPPALAATPASAPAPVPAGASAPANGGVPIGVGRVTLSDAQVRWRDGALDPPVALTTTAALTVDQLSVAPLARPTQFDLRVRVPDHVGELRVAGQATLDPTDLTVNARLQAQGVRAGPATAYLPPGQELALKDGRLQLQLEAEWRRARDGGNAARLRLHDMELAEAGASDPLLLADEVLVQAARLDPVAGAFLVDEVALRGLALDVHRFADRTELLGLRLRPPAGSPPPPAPPETRASAPAASRPEGGAPLARAHLPTVQLRRLDVGVARLTVHDPETAGSTPLALALALTNPEPLQLLGPDPSALPPLRLQLRGQCQPVVGALAADLELRPWAADPGLDASFELSGLRGAGLTEFLPALAARLDGQELEQGRLTARLGAVLHLTRRQPTDFDLGRGFGLEARLEDVVLRSRPDAEPVLGLQAARIDVARVLPRTGDVHVRSIEVVRPVAHLRQDQHGLHVAGLLLKPVPPAPPAAPTEGRPQVVGPGAAHPPELRVDVVSLAGLDVSWRDDTSTPPTVVPLTGLDVEVKQFTTRALREPLPVRFQVSLSAGPVDLPRHVPSASLLSPLKAVAGGDGSAPALERRPLLEELSASGVLKLWPWPEGWARAHLGQFELTGLRGLAQKGGVVIADGTLDAGLTLRCDARGTDVSARIVFGNLSLSEPADGPIARYLKLPAPLDTVLFVLQNQDGEQVIPMSFHIDRGGLDDRTVAGAAVATLGKVIARAIAASPLRVTGAVGGLVGLGGGAPEDLTRWQRRVAFEVADASVPPAERSQLRPLVDKLRAEPELVLVLEHQLGSADCAQASLLANPAPADVRALHAELRARRDQLLRQRDELAAQARAEFAVGRSLAAAATVAQVQGVERDLGETEAALDQALEFLRPGADSRRDRRAQLAATELARVRLLAVRDALLELGGHELLRRIELRRPRFEPAAAVAGGVTLMLRRRS